MLVIINITIAGPPGQRGEQQARIMVRQSSRIAITAMVAIPVRQHRRGLDPPRIIMAVTLCQAAVCGQMSLQTDGHLPSSGAGAGTLITVRIGPLNSLQAVLSAGRVPVLVVGRSVTAVPGTTPRAVAIKQGYIVQISKLRLLRRGFLFLVSFRDTIMNDLIILKCMLVGKSRIFLLKTMSSFPRRND